MVIINTFLSNSISMIVKSLNHRSCGCKHTVELHKIVLSLFFLYSILSSLLHELQQDETGIRMGIRRTNIEFQIEYYAQYNMQSEYIDVKELKELASKLLEIFNIHRYARLLSNNLRFV